MMYTWTMIALFVVVCLHAAQGQVVAPRQCGAAAGDPHIKVNNVPGWVTCSAPGGNVYLSNPFVFMTAIHVGVPGAFTLIQQVTIVLMDPLVGSIATYVVPNTPALFPTTFISGLTPILSPSGMFLATVNAVGKMVTIILTFNGQNIVVIVLNGKIGTSILSVWACVYPINGWPPFPFVTTGMLITGCPAGQVIGPLAGRRRRRQTEDCHQFGDYLDNCMFDAQQMGPEFAIEAGNAMIEGEHMMSEIQPDE